VKVLLGAVNHICDVSARFAVLNGMPCPQSAAEPFESLQIADECDFDGIIGSVRRAQLGVVIMRVPACELLRKLCRKVTVYCSRQPISQLCAEEAHLFDARGVTSPHI
jgi:hypothetical protein